MSNRKNALGWALAIATVLSAAPVVQAQVFEPDETASIVSNFASYAAQWRAEHEDLVWALGREAQLKILFESFRRANSSTEVTGVKCKTSWCRITMSYASEDEERGFAAQFLGSWIRAGQPCELYFPGTAVLRLQASRTMQDIFVRCDRQLNSTRTVETLP